MHRLSGGDDLALNLIMDRWKDRLLAFLYRRTGRYDVAMDLAQETFVNLYNSRARYKPSGAFSTYLFSIASNLVRNHVRWTQRHPTVSLDDTESGAALTHEVKDSSESPDLAYARSEQAEAIHSAFRALPDDLCEAMTLFIYEDLSYAEIAVIAGCSSKAAETRIYRARQMLKEKLDRAI